MNLLCPYCNEAADMHHVRVEVFERPGGEDGDGVKLVITRNAQTATAVPLLEKEMQGRRNAVVLTFDCWLCRKSSQLRIQQHKGVTIFEWLMPPDAPVEFEDY